MLCKDSRVRASVAGVLLFCFSVIFPGRKEYGDVVLREKSITVQEAYLNALKEFFADFRYHVSLLATKLLHHDCGVYLVPRSAFNGLSLPSLVLVCFLASDSVNTVVALSSAWRSIVTLRCY